jgi:Na+/proline symporter
MEILTKMDGVLLLAGYFVVLMFLVRFISEKGTKESYLVADRKMPWWIAAFSIAATWVWAPSMFVAAEKAYTQGLPGVFWFVVPNVLTLVLFGFFASCMRKIKPDGWTFSAFIREKYSNRTHNLYLVESFGLQTLSFAVQLLAGATILHKLCGLPFFGTTLALALIPLAYTVAKGIKASILTDFWQMLWIVVVLAVGLPIIFSNTEPGTFADGLAGATGTFGSLTDENGINVMLSFGIPTAIGLLSGTFGDQMFWQRVFSIREGEVKKSMMFAALIFAFVPVSLSFLGFIAAGAHLAISDTQLTNVASVIAFAPKWFVFPFLLLILSGLMSTVDSILCAVYSVSGHDISARIFASKEWCGRILDNRLLHFFLGDGRRMAKMAMIAVAIFAIIIANIPGMTIVYLFLLYGTLRSSVTLPSIWAIKGVKMSEAGLFWGILLSICVGLPIFAYGNLNGNVPMIVTGSLLTIGLSGILSLFSKEREKEGKPITVTVEPSKEMQTIIELHKELGQAVCELANAQSEAIRGLKDGLEAINDQMKKTSTGMIKLTEAVHEEHVGNREKIDSIARKLLKKMALVILLLLPCGLHAQVYDGITQPTRYRIWIPVSVNLHGHGSTSVSPFVGYKENLTDWLSATAVAQYNIGGETFVPQLWLNLKYNKWLWLLSRSIYDTKANIYRHALSATVKLPNGFMIDATWDDAYNGHKFIDTDRLQVLGGVAHGRFVVNAGYSMRNKPGVIANLRLKITDYDWLQFKYDGGAKAFTLSTALQFN